jgi:hypothetical protein
MIVAVQPVGIFCFRHSVARGLKNIGEEGGYLVHRESGCSLMDDGPIVAEEPLVFLDKRID